MNQNPISGPPYRTPAGDDKALPASIGSAALPGVFFGGLIGAFIGGEKHAITGAVIGWTILTVLVFRNRNK